MDLNSSPILRRLFRRCEARLIARSPFLLQLVYWFLRRPSNEITLFRSILRPGDTIFDVGAATGSYTTLFASLVGRQGSVHAFEAVPPTFASLMEVTKGLSNVHLNMCAVGESEGNVSMLVPGGDFSQAAMVRHSIGSWKDLNPSRVVTFSGCRTTTLDGHIVSHGIRTVAFVKCDVEGAEMLVVKGAKALLQDENPPIWFIESYAPWTQDFGYLPRDLFRLLEDEGGYQIFHLGPKRLTRVNTNDPAPGTFPDFLNFLAVVPSVHIERVRSLGRVMRHDPLG